MLQSNNYFIKIRKKRNNIITKNYFSAIGGHKGVTKTLGEGFSLRRIKNGYLWHMKQDILHQKLQRLLTEEADTYEDMTTNDINRHPRCRF
jgi:hypothetical protein